MTSRRSRTWVGGILCVAVLSGCNSSTLNRRELVVYFTAGATADQHAAALHACTGVAPHTSPEPIVQSSFAASRVSDVRFRIDHADDHDLAQLEACLARQPGVVGAQDSASLTN